MHKSRWPVGKKKKKHIPQPDSWSYQHFFESEAPDIAYGLFLLPFPGKQRAFPQFAFPDISAHLCFSRTFLAKTHCLFSPRGQIQWKAHQLYWYLFIFPPTIWIKTVNLTKTWQTKALLKFQDTYSKFEKSHTKGHAQVTSSCFWQAVRDGNDNLQPIRSWKIYDEISQDEDMEPHSIFSLLYFKNFM